MGCGSSKGVQAQNAPGAPPTAVDAKVEVNTTNANNNKITVKQIETGDLQASVEVIDSNNTSTIEPKERGNSAKSTDSGLAEDDEDDDNNGVNFVTEDTEDGEKLAGDYKPVGGSFTIEGTGFGKLRTSQRMDLGSAVSTKSAPPALEREPTPTIMERPKSRGGQAFEMTWDDQKTPTSKRPARLKALENRGKIHREATLAELEAKLEAAEKRRQQYERRVKMKMREEADKVGTAARSLTREKTIIGNKTESNEDKATKNREKHLKQLRDKLKAKEERAKRVRANKLRISQENEQLGKMSGQSTQIAA